MGVPGGTACWRSSASPWTWASVSPIKTISRARWFCRMAWAQEVPTWPQPMMEMRVCWVGIAVSLMSGLYQIYFLALLAELDFSRALSTLVLRWVRDGGNVGVVAQ